MSNEKDVDIRINRRAVRAIDYMSSKANIMNKTEYPRFGLSFSTSNTNLRMVNGQLTPVSVVAHRLSITLS